jgi:PAS domain S-box-containing protein
MSSNDNPRMNPESEAMLVESERLRRHYETVLSSTPDLVYIFGLDHRFVFANTALLELWGRNWDDAIGKTCLELGYETRHAEMHDREIEQVKATKKPIRGVVSFNGQHGLRQYDSIFSPVIGLDGEVEAIAGTTRDVTDRIASEEALRSSEAQYRQISEGLPQMVWSAGPDGVRDYFNGRWLQFTGVDLAKTDNPWTEVIHPDDVPRAVSEWENAVKFGNTFQSEYTSCHVHLSFG